MNRNAILSAATVAIALFGSGAALAQEANPTDGAVNVAVSTQSRAQVVAELQQARADGSIRFESSAYMEPLRVTKSRDQINTELVAAKSNGQFATINALVPSTNARTPSVEVIRVAGQ